MIGGPLTPADADRLHRAEQARRAAEHRFPAPPYETTAASLVRAQQTPAADERVTE
ncbi:hypothetical protein [Streptomyces luteolifulvus]|uniref:hypothetical protein n=1 Tax=Streptomyces luteolifulvus TaxID=2615112 RepID=UPI00177B78D5|nr:hypothetical protein [Streptomyces luteolifulvus]